MQLLKFRLKHQGTSDGKSSRTQKLPEIRLSLRIFGPSNGGFWTCIGGFRAQDLLRRGLRISGTLMMWSRRPRGSGSGAGKMFRVEWCSDMFLCSQSVRYIRLYIIKTCIPEICGKQKHKVIMHSKQKHEDLRYTFQTTFQGCLI